MVTVSPDDPAPRSVGTTEAAPPALGTDEAAPRSPGNDGAFVCPHCGGPRLVRNGRDRNGRQRSLCRDCGRASRREPGSAAHTEEFRRQVLASYREQGSLRSVCRLAGISRNTLRAWLRAAAAPRRL